MATLLANLLVSATGIVDKLSVDDAVLSGGTTRAINSSSDACHVKRRTLYFDTE